MNYLVDRLLAGGGKFIVMFNFLKGNTKWGNTKGLNEINTDIK